MHIDKSDVFWNYVATFLKIASSALLLPFILKMMPAETVGIWSVFVMISSFSTLLDFGFNQSFARNITYVYSGVQSLKTEGFDTISTNNNGIDYRLLKGVIISMRRFYFRMAMVLLILLSTVGTYYILKILNDFTGDKKEVYSAWALFSLINTYFLYTLYYDSLLIGKGLIKKSKQIIIIGQLVYLVIATILIMSGRGLLAIVAAQSASVIITRYYSHKAFFTLDLVNRLKLVNQLPEKSVIKAIAPNAIKIGLTSLGGFMVTKSAILIGSLYLSLEQIASYGITTQLLGVVAGFGGIYISTYMPKIAQLRVENKPEEIKEYYIKGKLIHFITFLTGALVLIFMGNWLLNIIGSETQILKRPLLVLAVLICFLENNHSISAMILLSKNKVPFYKASLLSGGATILFLLLLFKFSGLDLAAMIIAPGIAQIVYQNWKWPLEVIKELNIRLNDFICVLKCQLLIILLPSYKSK